MLLPSVSLAQNIRRVTGTVVDETGEALIGVTVTEPGGANGAITDLDGNFSLDLSIGTTSVQVSYVGYKTKTVTIPSSRKVTIQMESDENMLQETVVIGYGVQRRVQHPHAGREDYVTHGSLPFGVGEQGNGPVGRYGGYAACQCGSSGVT